MRRYRDGGKGGASRGERLTSITVTAEIEPVEPDETEIGGEGGRAAAGPLLVPDAETLPLL